MRSGQVALVGRTNVGKSTLLNALLGQPLAIVSPLPQTTREPLLGVIHADDLQIACIDTPGLHRPRHELGRRLNYQALETLRSAEVVVFVTEIGGRSPTTGRNPATGTTPSPLPQDDVQLLQAVPPEVPCILVLNKLDRVRNRHKLLPIIAAYSEAHPFCSIVPLSAKNKDGLDVLLAEIKKVLPEAAAKHDEDTLTDRPVSYFAREYIREQVLLTCRREVPHAVAVTIDSFEQSARLARIEAAIHVEKPGQRGVLLGRGGSMIKEIGTRARLRLEELLGQKVHLKLFVRVTDHWKNMPRQLAELGYETMGARSLSSILPLEDADGHAPVVSEKLPSRAKARPSA